MAGEVFSRYEKKYVIKDDVTFTRLLSRLNDHSNTGIAGDTYTISNLYYDTDDHYLIRTSLEKPGYKEKLRLRSYGTPQGDSPVYIEIKKKVLGLVNKRRCSMPLSEAYRFLDSGLAPRTENVHTEQKLSEIQAFLERYPVKPALYLSYDRIALGETDSHDLRVTFDTNILTRREDLRLESGCYGESLLPEGLCLMEIKVKNNMPLWLSGLLGEMKIYPTSFSKYGTEYRKMLKTQRLRIIPAMHSTDRPYHIEGRVNHA